MKFVLLVAAGALVVTAAGVFADTTFNAGGVASGTSASEVTVLSETHMLVKISSVYDSLKMDDPDHPYNEMSGTCFGSFEMRIPNATGGGHCIFADAAGNQSISNFKATGMGAGGALVGTWTIIGGTGTFAGATGGGTFNSLTDRETGKFENTVAGAMVLK